MKKRSSSFKKALFKPITVNDSRFGIRKMYLNNNEKPSIFTYREAGRGANGESSSQSSKTH